MNYTKKEQIALYFCQELLSLLLLCCYVVSLRISLTTSQA
jgi:hypothetical protein